MISEKSLLLFKDDFWKEKRRLKVVESDGRQLLEKAYENEAELSIEYSTISALRRNGILNVPEISLTSETTALMPYYKGIRIFNLLVELDYLAEKYGESAQQLKTLLVGRCVGQQRRIQEVLFQRRNFVSYPIEKIENVLYLLLQCLDINFDAQAIEREMVDIGLYWEGVVTVPFRDATPKNMLLNNDRLFLMNFCDEADRRAYLESCFVNGSFEELLGFPIIDYDFCSCFHDTTPEDDVISLLYHERTWNGRQPTADDLTWLGKPDAKRAAVSFLFRYLRFGGRRAAYRILHKDTSLARFKYDNDTFYFTNLPSFMNASWPDCDNCFPYMMFLIRKIADALKEFMGSKCDLFAECGFSQNERPYVDVYPN